MRVIDSHTEGEPTRVVLEGGPTLGDGPLDQRVQRFQRDFDGYRRAAIGEPRGYDALVGALLCEPVDKTCVSGVIFFNNTGYLGMCGHATIGTAVTLAHLGHITSGTHRFETPVGIVDVTLDGNNQVTFENVPSYLYRQAVSVPVDGLGTVTGDVAWGGNWFFLTADTPCDLIPDNIPELTIAGAKIRQAIAQAGLTGANNAEIDHIEFFGPSKSPDADSRNFVLCPGGAYDRSPCGTGTSAKLACLAASGQLAPGEVWVQESVIGSRFLASYQQLDDRRVLPRISGRAYICSEANLFYDPADPLLAHVSTA